MKLRLFLTLCMLTVLISACAPATNTVVPASIATEQSTFAPSATSSVEFTPATDLTATYTTELLSATPPSDAHPVATSRGPNLEATDPATVNLASGGLQFVEFFEFW